MNLTHLFCPEALQSKTLFIHFSVCTDASDLTRMYVSDEDEKIPIPILQI